MDVDRLDQNIHKNEKKNEAMTDISFIHQAISQWSTIVDEFEGERLAERERSAMFMMMELVFSCCFERVGDLQGVSTNAATIRFVLRPECTSDFPAASHGGTTDSTLSNFAVDVRVDYFPVTRRFVFVSVPCNGATSHGTRDRVINICQEHSLTAQLRVSASHALLCTLFHELLSYVDDIKRTLLDNATALLIVAAADLKAVEELKEDGSVIAEQLHLAQLGREDYLALWNYRMCTLISSHFDARGYPFLLECNGNELRVSAGGSHSVRFTCFSDAVIDGGRPPRLMNLGVTVRFFTGTTHRRTVLFRVFRKNLKNSEELPLWLKVSALMASQPKSVLKYYLELALFVHNTMLLLAPSLSIRYRPDSLQEQVVDDSGGIDDITCHTFQLKATSYLDWLSQDIVNIVKSFLSHSDAASPFPF